MRFVVNRNISVIARGSIRSYHRMVKRKLKELPAGEIFEYSSNSAEKLTFEKCMCFKNSKINQQLIQSAFK